MTSYPVRAVISAKEKRHSPIKHYVFIVEVKWSDGSTIPIYRQYSDFAQLNTDLKEVASSSPNIREQSLPTFPVKKVFQRTEVRKTASIRHHAFDDYCQALLKLDASISRHKTIVGFFRARPDDINPPQENRYDKSRRNTSWFDSLTDKILSVGGTSKTMSKSTDDLDTLDDEDPIYISSPIICQTYIAIADYIPEEKGEIKLHENMNVEVVEKYDNGWWFVQTEYGYGWAPATYLQSIGCSEEEEEEPDPIYSGHKYLTTEAYTGEQDDEITFPEGVLVKVLHKLLDGWWIIEYQGKVGYAPAAYMVSFRNPHFKESQHWKKQSRKPTKRRKAITNKQGQSQLGLIERDLSVYKRLSEKYSKNDGQSIAAKFEPKLSPLAVEHQSEQNHLGKQPSGALPSRYSKSKQTVKIKANTVKTEAKKKHEYDYIDEDEMDDIEDWVERKNSAMLEKVPTLPRRTNSNETTSMEDDSLPIGAGLVQVKPPVTPKPGTGLAYVKPPSNSPNPEITKNKFMSSSKQSLVYKTINKDYAKPSDLDSEGIYNNAAPGMVYAKAPTYKSVPVLPSNFVDSIEDDESTTDSSEQQISGGSVYSADLKALYSTPLKEKNDQKKEHNMKAESSSTSSKKSDRESNSEDAMNLLIESLKNRTICSVKTNESGELVIKFNDGDGKN